MTYIEQYNDLLQSGEIKASRRVRAIYAHLVAALTEKGCYVFDEARANRPIELIERFCRHSKGEWARKTIHLEFVPKDVYTSLVRFCRRECGVLSI